MAKKVSTTKSRGIKKKTADQKELIVVDEKGGLIFESEAALFSYFSPFIEQLEKEYLEYRNEADFSDEEQVAREHYLEVTLDDPDEVWQDTKSIKEFTIFNYIKLIEEGDETFRYIATACVNQEEEYPTFVFIHFPTKDAGLVANYQRGEPVYDKLVESAQIGSMDGDAIAEGDPVAVGLYLSMMKIRSEKDVPETDFKKYASLREESIEEPDEIWKKMDTSGNILVTFIKEFPDHEDGDISYLVVTQEDESAAIHALLYSFPTNDKTLVDRYRQGENLQAEEVSQESSH